MPNQLPKKWMKAMGYVIIPLGFILLCICSGSYYDNFTGLRNNELFSDWFYGLAIVTLLYLIFCLVLSGKGILKNWELILLAALIAGGLLVPYHDAGSLVSNLHIILVYAGFAWMNWLFFKLGWQDVKSRNIYFGALLLCVLLVITANSITGLSETIYVSIVSILLTYRTLQVKLN
ncbi:MAG: hypothetical protein LKF79_03740 [Solobacterium sp.]|jgi:hypothetical protein|nr:hypothetical protein [Solobacterium sp.]MCH4265738.1 hypothetical protein [Solobacterium sp.]